ncbi:hypothetical protein D0T53_03340 [Dysgonomonas sp. 216]|uniref:tetratricopeptide repeat protein n=1 Tax=Dysgonomonas sp. 216 TaxID=2302934 RepID=UPI0013D3A360|nr:tetratricopeptide repeat protein [Dysgonomonas sp. 216]NDW17951.1 hypothetical protein [Dysgonomonas sp. 216]
MKKRNLMKAFLVLLVSSISISAYAQNLGADYFNTGEIGVAKEFFNKNMSNNQAEANYYLGEIAYSEGNISEAKSYYEKGLAASSDYALNNVGLGKVLLKENNQKAAEDMFSEAIKKNKKDVKVLIAVARAYYINGIKDKPMQKALEDARKADKKSPYVYLFEGDMLKDANDPGGAAGQYAQAINFDPQNTEAYIKTAQVYETINPNLAIDNLNKVLEINPEYKLANKSLGSIYYRNGQYGKAIEAFSQYFAGGVYTTDDLTQYAASLYFSKRYDEAKKLIEEGLNKEPGNFVLNRLLMYSDFDSKDFEKGLAAGDKFFSIDKGTSEYIARDYLTYAQILAENKMYEKAFSQFELAIKIDQENADTYKLAGEVLSKAGLPAEAAEYFKKYIDKAGENAVALDYFNMGRYYYMAATKANNDSVADALPKAKTYLSEADSAFSIVTVRVPDSHLGVFWRARTNALLDAILAKESEALPVLARPYYEATIEILSAKEGNNTSELKEAYRYLSSSYYFAFDSSKNADDKNKTIEFSKKLQELDPDNAQAKQLLDALQ